MFVCIFQIRTRLVNYGHHRRYPQSIPEIQTHNQRPLEVTRNEKRAAPISPDGRGYQRIIPETERCDYSNQPFSSSHRMLPETASWTPSGAESLVIYRDNPPSYEIVSSRVEENPLDTGLPPPSYEEVMMVGFTQIRTKINANSAK